MLHSLAIFGQSEFSNSSIHCPESWNRAVNKSRLSGIPLAIRSERLEGVWGPCRHPSRGGYAATYQPVSSVETRACFASWKTSTCHDMGIHSMSPKCRKISGHKGTWLALWPNFLPLAHLKRKFYDFCSNLWRIDQ